MQHSLSFKELFALIPPSVQSRPGHVFHSGPSSLSQSGGLYLLGLNPAGGVDRALSNGWTVARQMQEVLGRRGEWSEYVDHSWNGQPAGASKMQLRVRHLLGQLSQDPRSVPASNVVFCCTPREADLKAEMPELLRACWPFHQMVIERLEVRAILCMGGTAGRWVRRALNADEMVGEFVEQNDRRWKTLAHRNREGRLVFTLTHPGIADWTRPPTDPSAMVARTLERYRR